MQFVRLASQVRVGTQARHPMQAMVSSFEDNVKQGHLEI